MFVSERTMASAWLTSTAAVLLACKRRYTIADSPDITRSMELSTSYHFFFDN